MLHRTQGAKTTDDADLKEKSTDGFVQMEVPFSRTESSNAKVEAVALDILLGQELIER